MKLFWKTLFPHLSLVVLSVVLFYFFSESLAVIAALLLTLGAGLSFVISRQVPRPVEKLTATAERIEQGSFLEAVPVSLREAACALGSTKLQVWLRVVIPSALSASAASFMLAVSRAIGGTMIVAIAAGQQPRLTFNPLVPIENRAGLYRPGEPGRYSSGNDRIQNAAES